MAGYFVGCKREVGLEIFVRETKKERWEEWQRLRYTVPLRFGAFPEPILNFVFEA
jgi:hypothetical protein